MCICTAIVSYYDFSEHDFAVAQYCYHEVPLLCILMVLVYCIKFNFYDNFYYLLCICCEQEESQRISLNGMKCLGNVGAYGAYIKY